MAEYKRSIGTGALRSGSGSSLPSLRSSPSSEGPPSPAEPYGFGEGPYGGGNSRAMHDVTKKALGVASMGRRAPAKPKHIADAFDWSSSTPNRPWMKRGESDTTPGRMWQVDDRGWVVGAKANSSPKVLRTADPVSAVRPLAGMRSATAYDVPKRVNWNTGISMAASPADTSMLHESRTVTRGRVLGGRKEYTQLAASAGGPYGTRSGSPPGVFPVRNPTAAQVEAYKHYEDKARRNSLREYKNGVAPRRLSSQEEKVAGAGWEARKTRQLSKVERLCDELYEAYSSGETTGCGAEAEDEELDGHDGRLDAIDMDGEKTLSMLPVVLPYADPPNPRSLSPAREQSTPAKRPPLVIQRKPVGSSFSIPLAPRLNQPAGRPSDTSNIHARSSSSPAIHPLPSLPQTSESVTQLRSKSSSPAKSNPRMRPLPVHMPNASNEEKEIRLPCVFPTAVALGIDKSDDVDEHWPTFSDGKPNQPTSSGTVLKRRLPEAAERRKWKTLEAVPLPFSSAVSAGPPYPRSSSGSYAASDHGIDEPSLEGPELLYSSSPPRHRRPTVSIELHPSVRATAAEARRLGVRLLERRGWFIWAVKVGMLCWVGVVLWALLDALREGLTRVLSPVVWTWGICMWLMGA